MSLAWIEIYKSGCMADVSLTQWLELASRVLRVPVAFVKNLKRKRQVSVAAYCVRSFPVFAGLIIGGKGGLTFAGDGLRLLRTRGEWMTSLPYILNRHKLCAFLSFESN